MANSSPVHRRYPTDANVAKKLEEQQQKRARGEVAQDEEYKCVVDAIHDWVGACALKITSSPRWQRGRGYVEVARKRSKSAAAAAPAAADGPASGGPLAALGQYGSDEEDGEENEEKKAQAEDGSSDENDDGVCKKLVFYYLWRIM